VGGTGLGGDPGRTWDEIAGHETLRNGAEVVSNMPDLLKQPHDLMDSGHTRPGDELWTRRFGELEKWKRPAEAAQLGAA